MIVHVDKDAKKRGRERAEGGREGEVGGGKPYYHLFLFPLSPLKAKACKNLNPASSLLTSPSSSPLQTREPQQLSSLADHPSVPLSPSISQPTAVGMLRPEQQREYRELKKKLILHARRQSMGLMAAVKGTVLQIMGIFCSS